MNIVKALANLLYQPDPTLSNDQKDGRFILELAIIVTLFFPLFAYIAATPYQGDLPPAAPLTKTVGRFITKECSKQKTDTDFCGFRSSDGKLFPIEYIKEYFAIREFVRFHDETMLFKVEGFYLLNGRGKYWLTKVSTFSGEVLLSETDSYSKLASMRSTTFLLQGLYIVAVVLWNISIRSVLRLSIRKF